MTGVAPARRMFCIQGDRDMSSRQTAGRQGPTSADSAGNSGSTGEHAFDQGGGQPGRGQSGGGPQDPSVKDAGPKVPGPAEDTHPKGKAPKAIIAGKDGPQTGGHERGNPGVGG